jgi:hypothetical protein
MVPKPAAAHAKVCEAHCTYGKRIDGRQDAPVAVIAPQATLTIRVISSLVHLRLNRGIFLSARSVAPPVSLLFSRFLI